MPVVLAPGLAPVTTGSLASLRQQIGDRLAFRVSGTVTSAAPGEATEAFVDATNQEPDNGLGNAWLLFLSGSNIGTWRQVSGNQDGYISFKKAWPAAIGVGDSYELYRKYRPDQILAAINFGIRNAFPYIYSHLEVEVPEDPTTTEYAMPLGMVELRQLRRRVNPQTVSGTGSQLIGTSMLLASALVRDTVYASIQVSGSQAGNIGAGQIFQINYGYGDAQTVLLTPGQTPSLSGGNTVIPVVSPTSGNILISAGGATTAYSATVDFPLNTPVQTMSAGVTPPVYVDLRGSDWEPQSERVRVFYRPASGQFLLFVGMGGNAELVLDTDQTPMPTEVVIAGAAQYLFELLISGESGSSAAFFEKQADRWKDYYESLKRKYAMQTIPWETHPPRIRVVRGTSVDLGPINP